MSAIVTLKKRAEFLRLRGGHRWSTASCVVETKPAPAGTPILDVPRFGFTITRQVGNAVVRNKLRRRLRAIVGQLAPGTARPGNDYVIIVRPAAAALSFADLSSQVTEAFSRVHRTSERRPPVRPAQSRERRR